MQPHEVTPVDPNSPAGIAAAASLGAVLADLRIAVRRRKRAARQQAA